MYKPKEFIISTLNISEAELLMHRAAKNIKYSERTDKYDLDSILEKRTMTVGLEKLISLDQKQEIVKNMENYSSLKRKLFSMLQKGFEFKNSGTLRGHRIIAKEYGFGTVVADSALSSAQGLYKSSNSWYLKSIKNLENKIKKLKTKIASKNKKESKPQQRGLALSESRLKNLKNQGKLSVWFGKRFLSGDKIELEKYKKQRLEFFVAGSASAKGNSIIRIEYSADGYNLKLFKNKVKVKIPNSHQNTFTLDNFNRQACRIAYNSKGKLVLHITYSYIRPIKRLKEKNKGSVGIDIGSNELAVCFVKSDGNPEEYQHFNIGNFKDKRSADTRRFLSLSIDQIINKTIKKGYNSIIIENLDLPQVSSENKKLNRLLSKFPWQVFSDLIASKCKRRGIQLKIVNPAFTSIIGLFKYSYRDNLSDAHHKNSKDLSAALVIGRRGLGFQERSVISVRGLIKSSIGIRSLLGLAEHKSNTSNVSRKSNWSLWKELARSFSSPKSLTAITNAKLNSKIERLP